MTDVNNFLMGGGGPPSAKFPTPGTTHSGTIVETEVTQQTTLEGELKVWPDGKPMMQAVITIQTEQRDPGIDEDDGRRRLFVKGQMQSAVRDAVKLSGAGTLQVGGKLAVKYVGDGERSSAGKNPPKMYKAQYAAPAINVDTLTTADVF